MSQTYDLVVRNGTIVDGSGAPGFLGDVAIRQGLIAAVARSTGRRWRRSTAPAGS